MNNEHAQAVIDDIITVYQHCVSDAVIARRLHLPESTVRHVIAHGTLPELQPAWKQPALFAGESRR